MEKLIKEHVLPEVNYAFHNTISYSQFAMYSRCQLQWYLSYVKKLDPKLPTIHTCFGTSIHEAIQHYLKLLYNDSLAAAEALDIEEYFGERFRANYQLDFDKIKKHFSSPPEMNEFFEDGINILLWFKKYRKNYFSTKKVKLLGVELPLLVKIQNNLFLKGFIDIVLYDEEEDKVIIFDIKTSSRGWGDKDKKDDIKISQLLIYKEFFSKQYGILVDKIDVQFFIVKRKLFENSEYVIPRIQTFIPANGKIKRKKAMDNMQSFIDECFDMDGKAKDREYQQNASKSNCKYCPFRTDKSLCDKGV